jgi:hypothetical protein
MASAFVQLASTSDFSGSGGNYDVTINGVTAGNTLFCAFSHDTNGGASVPTASVSDDKGNTWTAALTSTLDTSNDQKLVLFACVNVATGGNVKVTVDWTGSITLFGRAMVVAEQSGIRNVSLVSGQYNSHFDNAPGTSTDGVSSGTITPQTTGASLIVAVCMESGGNGTPAAGTGFTSRGTGWLITVDRMRLTTKAISGNSATAGTFTAPLNREFITGAIVFEDAVVGSAASSAPTLSAGSTGASLAAAAASSAPTLAGSATSTTVSGSAAASAPTLSAGATGGALFTSAGSSAPTLSAAATGGSLAAAAASSAPTLTATAVPDTGASTASSAPTLSAGATSTALKQGAASSAPTITANATMVQLGSTVFPLSVHASNRYLVDKAGAPFRPQTDTWFTLHAHFSQEEVDTILDALVAKRFTGIRLMAYVHACSTFGDDRNEPNDYYNNPPFTTPGHFDTPGTAYATNLQLTIAKCNARGLLVWLEFMYAGFPSTSQGWESELADAHNSNTVCFNLGAYLENTYGIYPNVVWMAVGDQRATGTVLARINKIIEGVESVRTSHLLGGELSDPDDHFPDDQAGLLTTMSTVDTWYGIGPSLNGRTYETADEGWSAAARPHGAGELSNKANAWNNFESREEVRMLRLWGVIAGGWAFDNSGDDASFEGNDPRFGGVYGLATLDSDNKKDMGYANALFASLPWFKMRPSGTASGYAGRTLISSTNSRDDDYIASAMDSDGQVLVAYVPHIRATSTVTFTVDCRSLNGTARARWWNPTTGTYSTNASAAGTFSVANSASAQSFTTPGDNGSSTGDWILLLDTVGSPAAASSAPTLAGSATSTAATASACSSSPTLSASAATAILYTSAGSSAPTLSAGATAAAKAASAASSMPVLHAVAHAVATGEDPGPAGYRPTYRPGYASGYRRSL